MTQKPDAEKILSTASQFNDMFEQMKPMLETIEKLNSMGVPVGEMISKQMEDGSTNPVIPQVPISIHRPKEEKQTEISLSEKTRYDLSLGLHIPQKYFGEQRTYTEEDLILYKKVAAIFSDDFSCEYDEDTHEIMFNLSGKKWNFCLITECCQVKVLSEVFRRTYDLLKSEKLTLTQ
jgi:hypothetical protein